MDKKFFNKSSNFFKKEGFYVILFVCLCVIATVAVVTTKSGKLAKKPATSKVAVEPNDQKENALKVQEPTNSASNIAKDKGTVSTEKNGAKAAPTASATALKWVKPIATATILIPYSEKPVIWQKDSVARPNWGIDINAKVGTSVMAVADGKVELVDENITNKQFGFVGDADFEREGVTVVISHSDGHKSIYCNLDKAVAVKKGDVVKSGQAIGKVGNTSLRTSNDKYGEHLHFGMIEKRDGKLQAIDPAKYIKY